MLYLLHKGGLIIFYFFIPTIIGIGLVIFGAIKYSNIIITLGANVIVAPNAFFIGTMATDPPGSTLADFLKGFLFVQIIPLLILLYFIILKIINVIKKQPTANT